MQYSIGDIFIDIRGVQQRTMLITEIYADSLGPIFYYYKLYTMPDEKHDRWSYNRLNIYIDDGYFIHYPVVK
jgi:hypothetical protein